MKRILCGFIMDGKAGGVDRYMLNLRASLVSTDVQMDFLTNRTDPMLKASLEEHGSVLYEVPSLSAPMGQYRAIKRILTQTKYDIVYFNFSTAINLWGPKAAKKCGVERIIIHSHSSANDCANPAKRLILNFCHHIGKYFLHRYGTDYFACSKLAGYWLFPKKVVQSSYFYVIPNAINTQIYSFSQEKRNFFRQKLGIENRFVLGNVGNFLYSKNHPFLIDTFYELHRQQPNSVLLLIGDGPELEPTRQKVQQLRLTDSVLFLGRKNTADGYYNAMDAFILPSHFEGLSIVTIEAQFNHLPCYVSDVLPEETNISDHIFYLPLSEPSVWANKILSASGQDRTASRLTPASRAYDLEYQAESLKKVILGLLSGT